MKLTQDSDTFMLDTLLHVRPNRFVIEEDLYPSLLMLIMCRHAQGLLLYQQSSSCVTPLVLEGPRKVRVSMVTRR